MTVSAQSSGDLSLSIGLFAGRLYGFAGLSTLGWALASGVGWDWMTVSFTVVCLGGYLLTLMPWDGRGLILSKLLVVASGAILVAHTPLLLRQPALLVLPALSAAYTCSALHWRWMVTLVPVGVALALGLSVEEGMRAGAAQAGLYLVLWAAVGSVSVWMRTQIEAGNRAVLAARSAEGDLAHQEAERQAAEASRAERELIERSRLAGALRDSIEGITGSSASIEQQSATIDSAVTDLASSLHQTAGTAARTEAALSEITAATAESQRSIGLLGSAGEEIVGIVDTITELSEQTNLLSLNATIEAARAGDSGRGFAVVANEVKDLARRTAEAASGIGTVVDRVQERLTASNQAIETIAELVAKMETDQADLTAAVSQQSQAVQEISAAAASENADVVDIGRAIRQLNDHAVELTSRTGSLAAPGPTAVYPMTATTSPPPTD